MKVPIWVVESAKEFWRNAGEDQGFPRDLSSAIPRALPLSSVLIDGLSLGRMRQWLQVNGIPCATALGERRLRGGLAAQNGLGIAFVDACDSATEQRYTLAHELAHFLRDYWQPRQQLEERLGPEALQVFDGQRAATASERLQAMLRFTPMRYYVHLLERRPDGAPANAMIASAEDDADRLACELLAPVAHMQANVRTWRDRSALQAALVGTYGFPAPQAERYAFELCPGKRESDPLLRALKITI